MKIVWAETALAQLAAIHEYIAQSSPFYADVMIHRLWGRGAQLAAFPESGRSVPEYQRPDIREIQEPPYRIMYQVEGDAVRVLAVVHARRSTPGLAL